MSGHWTAIGQRGGLVYMRISPDMLTLCLYGSVMASIWGMITESCILDC